MKLPAQTKFPISPPLFALALILSFPAYATGECASTKADRTGAGGGISCSAERLLSISERKVAPRHGEIEAYEVAPGFTGVGPARRANEAVPEEIDVTLPGHATALAKQRSVGARTWAGKSAGQYDAVIDSDGRRTYAHLFTDRELWVVFPDGAGHRLARIDSSATPPEAAPMQVIGPRSVRSTTVRKAATDIASTIDVLFVFTQETALAIGAEQGSLDLFAQHALSVENTVLANSQVDGVDVRLAGAVALDRHDGAGLSQDLQWAQADPAVGALRDAVGADIVIMIGNYGGMSGQAYVQSNPGPAFAPYAFAAVDRLATQNGLSLQHEFGHLLGMQHDPMDASPNAPPAYPYGYGHIVQPDETHTLGFLTVMSYQGSCGGAPPCYQIPYYSNATIVLDGDPVQGRAAGIADQRENYRVAIANAPIVAAFRTAPPPLLADSFE